MTTATTNKERAQELLSEVLSGNLDLFWDAMHPDVVLHEPDYLPYGGTYTGVQAFKECFVEVAKVIDPTTIELVNVTADEDRVIPLMTAKLVESGEEMHVMEQWRFEDDQIREIRVFWFGSPPGS